MFDDLPVLSREKWFSHLQELSKPFNKYGSFLPEQVELLEKIYEKQQKSRKQVWIFVAPPASGKTHVICLLAKTLAESSNCTAIVVPNNYLKEEFYESWQDVCGNKSQIDVLSLSQYVRSDRQYDFVLVDEAHNLKSFLELDTRVVRNLDITENDEPYNMLYSRYLPSGKEFVARQLSFSSITDILKILKRIPKFKRRLELILQEPTSWSCFIYIWKNLGLCSLKFVNANGIWKLRLPKKHLLMFTATPMSENELDFYCGISSDSIESTSIVQSAPNLIGKQRVCISIEDKLSFEDKLSLIEKLLQESNTRTLVLFNNIASCRKAFESFSRSMRNVFIIPSYARDGSSILCAFLDTDCGVLFTPSTVFWEGITIKNLKLLIIVEPPFPRPRLIELIRRKVTDGRTDMSRRLLQGIGRVGRRRGESGVVVTLFIPRIANSKSIKKEFQKMPAVECPRAIHELLMKPSQ